MGFDTDPPLQPPDITVHMMYIITSLTNNKEALIIFAESEQYYKKYHQFDYAFRSLCHAAQYALTFPNHHHHHCRFSLELTKNTIIHLQNRIITIEILVDYPIIKAGIYGPFKLNKDMLYYDLFQNIIISQNAPLQVHLTTSVLKHDTKPFRIRFSYRKKLIFTFIPRDNVFEKDQYVVLDKLSQWFTQSGAHKYVVYKGRRRKLVHGTDGNLYVNVKGSLEEFTQ